MLRVTSVHANGDGDWHTDQFEDGLGRLLRVCNTVVRGYGLPVLYEESATGYGAGTSGQIPVKRRKSAAGGARREDEVARTGVVDRSSSCFHISTAWTLEDPAKSHAGDLVETQPMEIRFDRLKVKVGNTVHDLPLT